MSDLERLKLQVARGVACGAQAVRRHFQSSVGGGIASEPRSETAKGSFRHADAPLSTELLPEVPQSWYAPNSVPLEPLPDVCALCWDDWSDDVCPWCKR